MNELKGFNSTVTCQINRPGSDVYIHQVVDNSMKINLVKIAFWIDSYGHFTCFECGLRVCELKSSFRHQIF